MIKTVRRFFPSPLALATLLFSTWVIVFVWTDNSMYQMGHVSEQGRMKVRNLGPETLEFPEYDAESFEVIYTRPLFLETRVPKAVKVQASAPAKVEVAVPKPAAIAPEAAPPNIQLLGVLSRSGRASALIRNSELVEKWYRPEETVDSWKIATIGSNFVILTNGSRELTIRIVR